MAVSRKRSSQPRVAEVVRDELRRADLRATPARVAVLVTLRAAPHPLSHAEVASALAPHGWDRATVFRNLSALQQAGLVARRDLGDHTWRFEATAREVHQHPHFLCTHCGTVACISGVEVVASSQQSLPRALRTRDVEIQIRGLCDDCGSSAQ